MEFISKTFSKYVFKTALRKEQLPVPFVEHDFYSFISAEGEQKWNA